MFFKQIYDEGLAQASYIIGCQQDGTAIVIDPRRDIDVYLEEAQKNKLQITKVSETHIHADYLSGSRELAKATGAKLYLSDEGDENWKYSGLEGFDYQAVYDGDVIQVGNIKIEVLHSPGHTPEHISFLVTDSAAADGPMMVLTGDFVFVGDIGRPDLLEEAAGIAGTAKPGAVQMFKSLKEKFLSLPAHVQVWPGHGAGSACGKALGAIPSSTVGYEKLFSWWADYLRNNDEAGFVNSLLAGQPEAPSYFAMMKKMNRDGMPILGGVPIPAKLTSLQFEQRLAEGAILVDTRDKFAFAGGHFKGSFNIPAGKNFSTWAGWLLPYETPLILLGGRGQVEELVRNLLRIGLDNVVGYIPSLEGYAPSELEVVPQVTAEDAKRLQEDEKVLILDVRAADEFAGGHIKGAVNIHAGRVMKNLEEIPRDRQVIVHCQGGDRSSTAISALMSQGFHNLANLTGGINAWNEHHFALESRQAVGA